MANYGKRMVPEYLVKGLEEAYTKTSGGTGSTINLMENIVDSKGNKRFVEGTLDVKSITGFTFSYSRFSLCGTHLMIVLAGSAVNGTSISNGLELADVTLPNWIKNKIKTVWSSIVEAKTVSFTATDWSTQTIIVALQKTTVVKILAANNVTLTEDRNFRIQFDLLIDNE